MPATVVGGDKMSTVTTDDHASAVTGVEESTAATDGRQQWSAGDGCRRLKMKERSVLVVRTVVERRRRRVPAM